MKGEELINNTPFVYLAKAIDKAIENAREAQKEEDIRICDEQMHTKEYKSISEPVKGSHASIWNEACKQCKAKIEEDKS